MSPTLLRLLAPLAVVAALLAACGGGDNEPDATATPEATGSTGSTGSTGATGSSGSSISSYTEVQPAVIQIVAQGTFRDPEVGLANGSGAGSGFIISPDGLAVTNNHVVAGAATLEVFIGGDDSRSYNASIVGVSECSDLALIDIRESDPLPYVEWFDGEIAPGLDVYVAGFPLGDPEFTLTRGIISKARSSGESDWSSLDYSIEHDASTQQGNSGGPLISSEGKVIGVHYASLNATNQSIFFAIPGEIAQDVVERLKEGDYEAIGINGWAVFDEALGISGIWVASVAAGSPAARAEIRAGDVITALNGLPMGTDGTMADYCDVFRTAGADKPMTVEVLRYDTGEILRGEINGDEPIEVISIADTIEDDTDIETDDTGSAAYTEYVTLTDDTETIIVDVPAQWDDVDGSECSLDSGANIPCLSASTNLTDYRETFTTPGLFFALYTTPEDLDGLLEIYGAPDFCDDGGVYDYSDPVYTGKYQIWENCGDIGSYLVVLAAGPEDQSYTTLLEFIVVASEDWDALDEAFNTFYKVQ